MKYSYSEFGYETQKFVWVWKGQLFSTEQGQSSVLDYILTDINTGCDISSAWFKV